MHGACTSYTADLCKVRWQQAVDLVGAVRGGLNLTSQAAHHVQSAIQPCNPLLIVAAHGAVVLVIKMALCLLEQEVYGTDQRSPDLLTHDCLRGRTFMLRGLIGCEFGRHANPADA
jgi:hypothetical protein